MMDLDSAIQHCEEVAKEQESHGYCDRSLCVIMDVNNATCDECEAVKCRECASEHRQLAEWLKELKDYRKTWDEIKKQIKEEASFACANFDEYAEEVWGEEDADELDDFRFGMQRALEIINEYIRVVNE